MNQKVAETEIKVDAEKKKRLFSSMVNKIYRILMVTQMSCPRSIQYGEIKEEWMYGMAFTNM